MFAKIITTSVAAASLFAAPALAQGADAAPAAAAEEAQPKLVKLTEDDILLGVSLLEAVNVAMAAEGLSDQVRTDMFLCVYNNKFSALSQAVGSVIEQNEALKRDVVNDLVNALIAVCQIPLPDEAAEAPTDEQR